MILNKFKILKLIMLKSFFISSQNKFFILNSYRVKSFKKFAYKRKSKPKFKFKGSFQEGEKIVWGVSRWGNFYYCKRKLFGKKYIPKKIKNKLFKKKKFKKKKLFKKLKKNAFKSPPSRLLVILHLSVTSRNTFVNFSDFSGNNLACFSMRNTKFKGKRRRSTLANRHLSLFVYSFFLKNRKRWKLSQICLHSSGYRVRSFLFQFFKKRKFFFFSLITRVKIAFSGCKKKKSRRKKRLRRLRF